MSWLGKFTLKDRYLVTEKKWGDLAAEAGGGVYFLIGLSDDSEPNKPALINRVCGADHEGILYIGEASSLAGRLGQLVRSLKSGKGHPAGVRYSQSTKLQECFPRERLAITWCSTEPPAYVSEDELVKAYADLLGEPPPLNAQGGYGLLQSK